MKRSSCCLSFFKSDVQIFHSVDLCILHTVLYMLIIALFTYYRYYVDFCAEQKKQWEKKTRTEKCRKTRGNTSVS